MICLFSLWRVLMVTPIVKGSSYCGLNIPKITTGAQAITFSAISLIKCTNEYTMGNDLIKSHT